MIEKLGRGSFGDVFKIYCKNNKNFFALKKIYINKENKKIMDLKIEQEFKIANTMDYKNIGTLFIIVS